MSGFIESRSESYSGVRGANSFNITTSLENEYANYDIIECELWKIGLFNGAKAVSTVTKAFTGFSLNHEWIVLTATNSSKKMIFLNGEIEKNGLQLRLFKEKQKAIDIGIPINVKDSKVPRIWRKFSIKNKKVLDIVNFFRKRPTQYDLLENNCQILVNDFAREFGPKLKVIHPKKKEKREVHQDIIPRGITTEHGCMQPQMCLIS